MEIIIVCNSHSCYGDSENECELLVTQGVQLCSNNFFWEVKEKGTGEI